MGLRPEIAKRTFLKAATFTGISAAASRLPTPNISRLLPGAPSDLKPYSSSEINVRKDSVQGAEIQWQEKGPFLVGNEDHIYTFRDYFSLEGRYLEVDLRLEFDPENYLTLLTHLARLTNKTNELDNYLNRHRLRIWLNAPPLGDGSAYYLAVGRWNGEPVLAYTLDEVKESINGAKSTIHDLEYFFGAETLQGVDLTPRRVSDTDVHEAWHLLEDATLVHKVPRSYHKPLGALGMTVGARRIADRVLDPRFDGRNRISRRHFLRAGVVAAGLYAGATLGSYLSTPLRLLDHREVNPIVDRLVTDQDIKNLPGPFKPTILRVS